MARAMRREARSSPNSNSRSASSRSGSVLTRSAAVGPLRLMRMSSGPSPRNEKPRAGSSSWNDDTPRSSTTPSSAVTPCSRQQVQHVAELAVDQVQPAGKARGEAGAAGDRLGIAIDRPDRAGRRLEERRRVAAAAERAVQIDAAGARGEQADDLGQHDGDMGVHGMAHCGPFPGRVKPCDACPLARLGAAALGRGRLPDLEDAAETHEHHGLGKSGIGDEGIRQNDAAFLVRLDRKCIRIQRGSQIIVSLTEEIESVQRLRQRFEYRSWATPRCRDAGATAAARGACRWPRRQAPGARRGMARGRRRVPWRRACSGACRGTAPCCRCSPFPLDASLHRLDGRSWDSMGRDGRQGHLAGPGGFFAPAFNDLAGR